ncbi:hypothetical protein AGMMS49944_24880 [Spirochaetia bacterium]|nr:hypothetical protein AGMMS49944_24880 [Spirochaetia bacterium]
MDYEKIYEESELVAPLQSVEDGLSIRESLSVEMFRKVYREANNDQTGKYGVVEGNDLVPNSQPGTLESAYNTLKQSPSHGSKNTTLSQVDPETQKAGFESGSQERVIDDQNNLIKAVVKYDKEELEKAEERFYNDLKNRMRNSTDLQTLIDFYLKNDPTFLDEISTWMLSGSDPSKKPKPSVN